MNCDFHSLLLLTCAGQNINAKGNKCIIAFPFDLFHTINIYSPLYLVLVIYARHPGAYPCFVCVHRNLSQQYYQHQRNHWSPKSH